MKRKDTVKADSADAVSILIDNIRNRSGMTEAGLVADQTLKRVYDTPSAGGVNLVEAMTCDWFSRLISASVVGAGTVNVSYDNRAYITHRTSASDPGNVGACGCVNDANRVSNAGGLAFACSAQQALCFSPGPAKFIRPWSICRMDLQCLDLSYFGSYVSRIRLSRKNNPKRWCTPAYKTLEKE